MKLKYIQMLLQAIIALVFLAAAAANLAGMMTPAIMLLGFPEYLTTFLGVAYPLGVIAIYQTKFIFLQEWAWAGFMISLVGASAAHMYTGFESAAPAIALQVLVMATYLLKLRIAKQYNTAATSAYQ